MIYFLVTTCLLQENHERRKADYIKGINSLLYATKNISDKKIIIIENNGARETFLDDFVSRGCEIIYTENNKTTYSKGYKELCDVFEAIIQYDIQDSDFIVKFTGRYFIEENSKYFTYLSRESFSENTDAIIKYGWFHGTKDKKEKDCVTGLIGMKCKYLKQMPLPRDDECIEWKWAEATYLMDDSNIVAIQGRMGLLMIIDTPHEYKNLYL